MPDNVDLGECVGLGAWTSCDMYCAAILEVCVESGCDGSTVVYYDDVNVCTAMTNGSGSAQSCSDGFDMSGQNSFARCCCGQL